MESPWNIKSHDLCSCNSHVLSPITPQQGAAISCDHEVTSSSWETQSIIFIKWWQLLEPQIILIFSCLSSYVCNPQWLQHQYQTAQAFIFQFAVEWNTSSDSTCFMGIYLQYNTAKQNLILKLSQSAFFISTPFSLLYWFKNNGDYQRHVRTHTSLQSP